MLSNDAADATNRLMGREVPACIPPFVLWRIGSRQFICLTGSVLRRGHSEEGLAMFHSTSIDFGPQTSKSRISEIHESYTYRVNTFPIWYLLSSRTIVISCGVVIVLQLNSDLIFTVQ